MKRQHRRWQGISVLDRDQGQQGVKVLWERPTLERPGSLPGGGDIIWTLWGEQKCIWEDKKETKERRREKEAL